MENKLFERLQGQLALPLASLTPQMDAELYFHCQELTADLLHIYTPFYHAICWSLQKELNGNKPDTVQS